MSRLARGALLGALGAAAALSLHVTGRHFDARDVERAVHIARAHQYGPTTRARVDAWLVEERPGAHSEWTAEMESALRGRVRVTLEVRDAAGGVFVGRWRVDVPSRDVEPIDAATRAFTERIAAWANDP